MRQLLQHIVRWFLPVLFIMYMGGITLFTHSHVVNGVTIVHSHPFKKSAEHTHSTIEFELIHLLNHVLITDVDIFSVLISFTALLLCVLTWRLRRIFYAASGIGAVQLRAPPSFCL